MSSLGQRGDLTVSWSLTSGLSIPSLNEPATRLNAYGLSLTGDASTALVPGAAGSFSQPARSSEWMLTGQSTREA